tara:strand:+ start:263 stop:1207 length:945 start_codon:yes stop_codon:yes gene_type:complete
MARSKRTQKQIQDKKANKYDFVGDKEVASHLGEIEFQASTLETIDGAMMKFIDEELNLSVSTNDGFKKVPVLWVTAERAYQLKHNKDLRDKEQTLVLPLITVSRMSVTKEPDYRGTVYANLYPVDDARGGTITIAREINQKKTAEFQNAAAARKLGPDHNIENKMANRSQRDMTAKKTVYETVTIPLPVWVKVVYQISLRTEYQQQINELVTPFFTVPGNSRMPKRITNEGHAYEVFVQGNFSNQSNQNNLAMEQRNYETDIDIEVMGYLVGEGTNQEKPKIVRRQNAVEFKIGRERTVVGSIPYSIKDGFYRE